jgi:uncharacterized protein (DUF1330 family)
MAAAVAPSQAMFLEIAGITIAVAVGVCAVARWFDTRAMKVDWEVSTRRLTERPHDFAILSSVTGADNGKPRWELNAEQKPAIENLKIDSAQVASGSDAVEDASRPLHLRTKNNGDDLIEDDSLTGRAHDGKDFQRYIQETTWKAPEQRRSFMAKAYWIAVYRSVSNPDALAAYAKLSANAMTAARGKILARGEPAAVLESGLKQRTVIVEFESVAAALAAYQSPGYQEALRVLGTGSAERDIRIIEAVWAVANNT